MEIRDVYDSADQESAGLIICSAGDGNGLKIQRFRCICAPTVLPLQQFAVGKDNLYYVVVTTLPPRVVSEYIR